MEKKDESNGSMVNFDRSTDRRILGNMAFLRGVCSDFSTVHYFTVVGYYLRAGIFRYLYPFSNQRKDKKNDVARPPCFCSISFFSRRSDLWSTPRTHLRADGRFNCWRGIFFAFFSDCGP